MCGARHPWWWSYCALERLVLHIDQRQVHRVHVHVLISPPATLPAVELVLCHLPTDQGSELPLAAPYRMETIECEECGRTFCNSAGLFTHQKKKCGPGKRSIRELLSDAKNYWKVVNPNQGTMGPSGGSLANSARKRPRLGSGPSSRPQQDQSAIALASGSSDSDKVRNICHLCP
jgi:hypothetical protein